MMGKNSRDGFTLIEVVLVLAIGGLLFFMAFLAFSSTQKNRRDTERRAVIKRIFAELKSYRGDTGGYPPNSQTISAANTCGAAPIAGSFHEFIQTYLCRDGEFNGPNNVTYSPLVATSTNTTENRIRFRRDYDCSGYQTGKFRVDINLEGGNKACIDGNLS